LNFIVGSYRSKYQSNSSSPPPIRPNDYHQRHQTSSEYHQYNLNKSPLNFEIRGRISSPQSSSKSRSGLSDNEDHQMISSSLPKSINKTRKRSISYPISHQSSKEKKTNLFNSNHNRTNSNRSRLSSTSPVVSRMDRNRRKALKLLIVIILEFFICWTPLFIYHTIVTFDKKFHRSMPTNFVDLILLFSFASPLCNPFTYYFMSKRYRAVLYAYLPCCNSKNKENFNKQNNEARQVIKALRLHQQQNTLEYKKKINQQKFPSMNHIQYYSKSRSNTLE